MAAVTVESWEQHLARMMAVLTGSQLEMLTADTTAERRALQKAVKMVGMMG